MSEEKTCAREGCLTKPRNGAEYCSRHRPKPKTETKVVEKLKSVNEKRKVSKTKAREKDEPSESYFLITISTNQSANDKSIDMIDGLNEYLFGSDANIDQFLVDRNGKELNIIDIERLPGAVEISDRYGRVHVHSALAVKHRNKIKVDRDQLSAFCKQATGINCYVNITVASKDDFDHFKQYAIKNA